MYVIFFVLIYKTIEWKFWRSGGYIIILPASHYKQTILRNTYNNYPQMQILNLPSKDKSCCLSAPNFWDDPGIMMYIVDLTSLLRVLSAS